MPVSLAEIKLRAIQFSKEWSEASRERADAQTFWNEFFAVFGRSRKLVATFEEPVKNLKGDTEFIDLFWPGKLIAEHKSRGQSLDKANSQAMGYIHNLANTERAEEAPEYMILSDFSRLALIHLADDSQSIEFPLEELSLHIRRFAFIAGYQTRKLDPEDPANFTAVEKLANLHDQLEAAHFTGHSLERFLVRVLFCLFAEDTEIFEPESFKLFLLNHTQADGSDLGPQLSRLFQTLDKPPDQRPPNLPEDLAAFPYVNGQLFAETLQFPEFTSRQRNALLDCARFQWAKISPAIFGSLFQAAMQPKERRQIGAHYTSERDILKLIHSLFLDDLRAEFHSVKSNKKQLAAFHDKLAGLKFLDPACGCGNFLVITYRELRLLELDVLKTLHPEQEQRLLNISELLRLNVDQMYGIEIEEWPARIAEVALWLLDHQMNQLASETFGNHYARLPIQAAPTILIGNALRTDWNTVLPHAQCGFILGNPPFVGKQYMDAEQKEDMDQIVNGLKGGGLIDYVTAWYLKAIDYMRNTSARAAFVSTNSITQGEQVGVIWPELFRRGCKIHFGHRTFDWQSEARGKAQVDVVIIGFGNSDRTGKRIYDYELDPDNPAASIAPNISPYLTNGGDAVVTARTTPICEAHPIVFGSMPNDGGHLILGPEERRDFIAAAPGAAKYLRPFMGAQEFLDGSQRWCLWLVDAPPSDLLSIPAIASRINRVRLHRNHSKRNTTKELAGAPSLFGEIRQPKSAYLLIPSVTSETRRYIPMGFMPPRVIASNLVLMIPRATLFEFGVLTSRMHMAWMRSVAGRLESRFRYSNAIVYNNFPWPQTLPAAKRRRIEQKAQAVLDARDPFLKSGSTYASLYGVNSMPNPLFAAHRALDLAVDRAYRSQPFPSDIHRFEFLFALYEQLTTPLMPAAKKTRPPR